MFLSSNASPLAVPAGPSVVRKAPLAVGSPGPQFVQSSHWKRPTSRLLRPIHPERW